MWPEEHKDKNNKLTSALPGLPTTQTQRALLRYAPKKSYLQRGHNHQSSTLLHEAETETETERSSAVSGAGEAGARGKPAVNLVYWPVDDAGAWAQTGSFNCPKTRCLITKDRRFLQNESTRGFIWQGADLDLADMPVPRKPNHWWILFNRESPCNYDYRKCCYVLRS
jgi:hypothetical protein